MPQQSPTELSTEELQRYRRQALLPEFGEEGQRRLTRARVLLVGAGGLGSPVALSLAAAGVGYLGIVDADVVELENLHRRVLHSRGDIGRPRTASARARIADLDPHVQVATLQMRLTSANAMDVLRDYDVVVDSSGDVPTHSLVSDACVLLGIPDVYGSATGFDGHVTVFAPPDGPCYRCLVHEPPPPDPAPGSDASGVLGVLPGLVGLVQAAEAIKRLTGAGEPLIGRVLLMDAIRMRFRTMDVTRDPACPACGTREITAPLDCDTSSGVSVRGFATEPAERDVAPGWPAGEDVDPAMLAARLREGNRVMLLDVREPYEWAIARLPEARLVPLNSLPRALQSLDREVDLVVYCHHGSRSAAAVAWLHDQGFSRASNLVGGIDRWTLEVDPSLQRY